MRRCFYASGVALAAVGLFVAGSISARAQSGSRTEAPRGSGERAESHAPLALEGYCPVSILEMRQWVKGDPAYQAVYDGRTYRFANAQGKKMFEGNAAKYVPALGGDCVVALVKMGKRVPGNIRFSAFHGGRLFLFSNEEGQNMFLADPVSYANVDLALNGNCPVCAAGGVNAPGKPEIAAFHKGLRYLFPSVEMRDQFLANPAKYASPMGSGTRSPAGSKSKPPTGSGSGRR